MWVQLPHKPTIEGLAHHTGYAAQTIEKWRQEDLWDLQRERHKAELLRSMFKKRGLTYEILQAEAVSLYRDVIACCKKIVDAELKSRDPNEEKLKAAADLCKECHVLIQEAHPDSGVVHL